MVRIRTKETEENVEDLVFLDMEDKEILRIKTDGCIHLRGERVAAPDQLLGRIIAAYSRWVRLAASALGPGE